MPAYYFRNTGFNLQLRMPILRCQIIENNFHNVVQELFTGINSHQFDILSSQRLLWRVLKEKCERYLCNPFSHNISTFNLAPYVGWKMCHRAYQFRISEHRGFHVCLVEMILKKLTILRMVGNNLSVASLVRFPVHCIWRTIKVNFHTHHVLSFNYIDVRE